MHGVISARGEATEGGHVMELLNVCGGWGSTS